MTGMSLSLLWLDDDLKTLLDATASSPAFTSIGPDVTQTPASASRAPATGIVTPAETDAVREEDDIPGGEFGERARAALRQALATIEEMESELGRLDAAAGDGDHGAGMVRGLRAAVEAIEGFGGTARQTFRRGGIAFQNAAGGASGALVGAWLIAIGTGLPDRDEAVDAAAVALALDQALATLQRLGQAQPGDKTMVDTLAPFSAALNQAAAARNGDLPSLGRGSTRGGGRDALDDRHGQPPWPRLAPRRALARRPGCRGDIDLPRPARVRRRVQGLGRVKQYPNQRVILTESSSQSCHAETRTCTISDQPGNRTEQTRFFAAKRSDPHVADVYASV